MNKQFLIPIIATLMLVVLIAPVVADDEGDYAQSALGTDYFTISDPGGGAQNPPYPSHTQTYTCSDSCQLTVFLQDVGSNPNTDPKAWNDDIANVYVDGVLIGTYDSLNNPTTASPGVVQSFTTGCLAAGQHTIKIEVTYSAISGSKFAKDVTESSCVIPEFSTIAIPVVSILGLLFFFNYRKRKREQ